MSNPAPSAVKVTTPSDRQILITRAFNAPRRLVWKAMTSPEFIRRWVFAPPEWTMPACEEDLRVGGAFRWEWTGADGTTAMVMRGQYREVVPPGPDGSGGRIVRSESFELGCDVQMGEQIAAMDLIDQGDRTALRLTITFPSKEARDGAIQSGMEQGVAASYDRLAEVLAAEAAAR